MRSEDASRKTRNLPFHLLDPVDYDHQVYCAEEIRDVRSIMEGSRRAIESFYQYFPLDITNRQYMDSILPEFYRLEMVVDMWETTMANLSEEEARSKLDNMRWKAMKVLSCIGPAIEAYRQVWCMPATLPPSRQVEPHIPKISPAQALINNPLGGMPQLPSNLKVNRQRLEESIIQEMRSLNEDLQLHQIRLRRDLEEERAYLSRQLADLKLNRI